VTTIVAGGPLATLHALVWIAAVALAAAGLVVGFAALLRASDPILWLDRILLGYLAAVILDELVGVANAAVGPGPGDPLHLLYGVLALVAAPVGRYLGRAGTVRRRTAWNAAGWAVSLGFLVRLFMTGSG
jgi:hypothetical protein